MNPMALLQLKNHFVKFQNNHPKVVQFFQAVPSGVQVGSVIEISITDPQGKEISTNMRVTEDDIELLSILFLITRVGMLFLLFSN